MLIPVGKRILVKPVENPTKGSLILPHSKKPTSFSVVSIGDEVTKAKVNDIVFLEVFLGIELEYNGEKFTVIEESSILAKVEV